MILGYVLNRFNLKRIQTSKSSTSLCGQESTSFPFVHRVQILLSAEARNIIASKVDARKWIHDSPKESFDIVAKPSFEEKKDKNFHPVWKLSIYSITITLYSSKVGSQFQQADTPKA